MFIFIKHIPKSTTLPELIEFLELGLTNSIFRKSGKILSCRIVLLRDKRLNRLNYHGLVKVDSEKTGNTLIKKLNNKGLKGLHVQVREYHFRSYKNDRRQLNAVISIDHNNRRADRRRGKDLEEITHITEIVVESYDNSRKLI
jgi:hypothetical protein